MDQLAVVVRYLAATECSLLGLRQASTIPRMWESTVESVESPKGATWRFAPLALAYA